MAAVYKRGKSRFWWCRIHGHRVSTKCTDKRAAEKVAARLEREGADAGGHIYATSTLEDGVAALLSELRARGRSTSTLERAAQKLAQVARVWGATMLLRDLDHQVVASYIEQRRKDGRSGTTIRDELAFIRQMLKVARRDKLWRGQPSDVMPLIFEAGHKPVERYLTQEEAVKLLAHLEPRRASFVAFILATGARLGEALRAQPEDVGEALVYLRGTKTDASASSVPVVPMMLPWLYFAMRRPPPFEPWLQLHRDVRRASKRARVPYTTPNDWRRSMAHWLGDAGATPTHVAGMLRHSTDKLAQTTYNKTKGERLATAMRAGVPEMYRDRSSEPHVLDQLEFISPRKVVPSARVELATNALGKRSASIEKAKSDGLLGEWPSLSVSELAQLEALVGGWE